MGKTVLTIKPEYGGQDPDTMMFLHALEEQPPCRILEVGANQEYSCRILADNGYDAVGVDLNPHDACLPHNYLRIQTDFVRLGRYLLYSQFDVAFSTSALEHFGLGTYGDADLIRDPDYDQKAVRLVHMLLKPGGTFYVTVPYGKHYLVHGIDWRVYNQGALEQRIIWPFKVEKQMFFKSAECPVPSYDVFEGIPLVLPEVAAEFDPGSNPHLTVFLKLRKG